MSKVIETIFQRLANINVAACLVLVYAIALVTDISRLGV